MRANDLRLGEIKMKERVYQFVTELMDFKPRTWRRIQISSKLNIEDLMDVMMIIYDCQMYHLYELTLPKGENDYYRKRRENLDYRGKITRNDIYYPGKMSISRFYLSEEEREELRYHEEEMKNERSNPGGFFDFQNENDSQYILGEVFNSLADKVIDLNKAKETIEKQKQDLIENALPKISYEEASDLIETLDLETGDKLYFTYDFGDNWEFKIKLEKILDPEEVKDPHVPRVLTGKGQGVLEDIGGTWGLREFLEEKDLIDDYKYYYKSDHNPILREMFEN